MKEEDHNTMEPVEKNQNRIKKTLDALLDSIGCRDIGLLILQDMVSTGLGVIVLAKGENMLKRCGEMYKPNSWIDKCKMRNSE